MYVFKICFNISLAHCLNQPFSVKKEKKLMYDGVNDESKVEDVNHCRDVDTGNK